MGNKNTNCCTQKATCSSVTCPAGYKKKSGVDSTACTSDTASCAVGSTCCEADTNKCGGLTGISCTTSTHYTGTDDTWKNTAATNTNKNTNCCIAKATCSAFQLAGP